MKIGDRVEFKRPVGSDWKWDGKLVGTVTRTTGLSTEAKLDDGSLRMDVNEHVRPVSERRSA